MSSPSSEPPSVPWLSAPAHTDPSTGALAETVAEHVERVAAAVGRRLAGAPPELRRLAIASALVHDVGKATPWFVGYLLQKAPKSLHTRHSQLGAVLAWCLAARWPLGERAALLQHVLRHHGRPRCIPWREVEALRQELSRPDGAARQVLLDQLEALDRAGLAAWLARRTAELELDPERAALDAAAILAELPTGLAWRRLTRGTRAASRSLQGFVRDWTAYGALLISDRLDVATSGAALGRAELPRGAVEAYVSSTFEPPGDGDRMAKLRVEVSEKVREAMLRHREHRLFTLTAPTGSGKTLAVLRAALGLRETVADGGAQPPRLIYCLPFTSVIDQNHRVFADVLAGGEQRPVTTDVLLKHHHLTPTSYRDSGDREWEADGAGRLLVETWQSEVVVSTFHQLLHTFLSGLPRDAMRAPAWLGATVILDEVQSIPLRYWAPVGRLLESAAQVLDARFVLMTATRPLIFADGAAIELLDGFERFFDALDRVDLVVDLGRDRSVAEIGDEVVAARERGAVLCILNTRAAVRETSEHLAARLGRASVLPLSTTLTPRDRKARIAEIDARSDREPLVVVSTQLVEAGVDLSFPTVIRDMAPLDCVIQSAGRCNRHGAAGRGRVMLISMAPLKNGQLGPARQVYDPLLLDVSRQAISFVAGASAVLPERRFLELSEAYFTACRSRSESVDVDVLAAEGDYEALSGAFELIEERAHRLWFVRAGDEAAELWGHWASSLDELAAAPPGSHEWFEARSRLRSLRHRLMEHVVQEPVREEIEERIELLPEERYDPVLGLVPEGWTR